MTRRGIVWAVLGILPLLPVMHVWSGYYFVFALCGVALAVGAWCAARPARQVALVLALLLLGSELGRSTPAFETGRGTWSPSSHVNRTYIVRATRIAGAYLSQLRELHPTLPPGSTLYFSDVLAFVGFQEHDGPLLRWAYRDTSLRSYFGSQYRPRSERAAHGPDLFLRYDPEHQRWIETTRGDTAAHAAEIPGAGARGAEARGAGNRGAEARGAEARGAEAP